MSIQPISNLRSTFVAAEGAAADIADIVTIVAYRTLESSGKRKRLVMTKTINLSDTPQEERPQYFKTFKPSTFTTLPMAIEEPLLDYAISLLQKETPRHIPQDPNDFLSLYRLGDFLISDLLVKTALQKLAESDLYLRDLKTIFDCPYHPDLGLLLEIIKAMPPQKARATCFQLIQPSFLQAGMDRPHLPEIEDIKKFLSFVGQVKDYLIQLVNESKLPFLELAAHFPREASFYGFFGKQRLEQLEKIEYPAHWSILPGFAYLQCLPNLKELILHNAYAVDDLRGLAHLKHLETLTCTIQNPLSLRHITNPKLKVLNICTSGPEPEAPIFVREHWSFLQSMPNLERLSLDFSSYDGMNTGSEGDFDLDALRFLPKLKALQLNASCFENQSLQSLPPSLEELELVDVFHLQRDSLKDLPRCCPHLRELSIILGMGDCVLDIGEHLRMLPHLQILKLHVQLTDTENAEDFRAIADSLEGFGTAIFPELQFYLNIPEEHRPQNARFMPWTEQLD